MLRLERLGFRHLERKLGEEDDAYLLRTKKAFPGVFDDVIAKPAAKSKKRERRTDAAGKSTTSQL